MDKYEYFPRKKLFEESQDLVATFYSTGDYISDSASDYSTMLDARNEKDVFYYSLYLLSMLSNANSMIKIIEHVVKSLNSFRQKRKVTSIEEFAGEINIEEYINKNYVEKVRPKEYPSIIKYSSYQLPEYQLTLYIIRHIEEIYHMIFEVLGNNEKVTAFKKAHKYHDKLRGYELILRRKYGIDFSTRETYLSLRKKVTYRYRNRKILTDDYKNLMKLYEKMLQFKGIDFESNFSLEVFEHYPEFDDRLYEIWLIRKSAESLSVKMGQAISDIVYTPLFMARKNNECVARIDSLNYRIEILFQNRKMFMPKEELKWYYWNDKGEQDEIGAIPDLIFMKYINGQEEPSQIVLVDAKNRTWTFDKMEPIKAEIVQQIYIHDNFISLFEECFCSMLVAHNIEQLQTRKYYHKDKAGYEIDVISMDMNEHKLQESLDKFTDDLGDYLEI